MNHIMTAGSSWEDSVDFLIKQSRAAVEAEDGGWGQKAPSGRQPPEPRTDGKEDASRITTAPFPGAEKSHAKSPAASLQKPGMNALQMAREIGAVPRGNEDVYDMICIGFGPASLAIAIALADTYAAIPHSSRRLPRILFLEKQEAFAWHSGMQIPEAKMQISFLKDLATPRDPTSPFSFVNYLHQKGRLSQFINLGTFLPSRLEYEDYLRWCADYFETSVLYSQEVERVECGDVDPTTGRVKTFTVSWKSTTDREPSASPTRAMARHVVVAVGGQPYLPEEFQTSARESWPGVQHSSQYATTIRQWETLSAEKSRAERAHRDLWEEGDRLLKQHDERIREIRAQNQHSVEQAGLSAVHMVSAKDLFQDLEAETKSKLAQLKTHLDEAEAAVWKAKDALHDAGIKYGDQQRFIIVGNGQSAVEIFNDLWSRFPEAYVTLVIKGASLRPSDDSPFVNEIFDPERVDGIYNQDPAERAACLKVDRGTNYGVVRLNLLEHIYEKLYVQRIKQPDESKWKHRILTNRVTTAVDRDEDANLVLKLSRTGYSEQDATSAAAVEEVTASHVFVATGYVRNAHEGMLKETIDCLPAGRTDAGFPVARDYRVLYDSDKVDPSCGVWLQGCNESTHGLADSLLSIAAVRGGEMVRSIFGRDIDEQAAVTLPE